jgi:two-component system sensor histidine kinase LytS
MVRNRTTPYEKLDKIGKTSVHSESGTGSALENLNRRLDGLTKPV